MASVTEQFISTGFYSFTNAGSGQRLSVSDGKDEVQCSPTSSYLSDIWVVFLLPWQTFVIRKGGSDLYAYPGGSFGEGNPIFACQDSHEWIIEAVKGSPGIYQIYSRIDSTLFWSSSADSTIKLSRDVNSNSTRWILKREEDIPTFGALPAIIAGVRRPVEKVLDNNFEVTIPKGWTAFISGVAHNGAMNAVHIQTVYTNILPQRAQLCNKHDEVKLTLRGSVEDLYQISADAGPVALGLALYSSTDRSKVDPFIMSYVSYFRATLSETFVDRTIGPDQRIYYITTSDHFSKLTCSVITISLSQNGPIGI